MLRFLILILLLIPITVYAAPHDTVLLEVMSTTTCNKDPKIQDKIRNIMMQDENIILLNCRTQLKDKLKNMDPNHKAFCQDKITGYYRVLNLFMQHTPMVIINGTYEANNDNIKAAIGAARSLDSISKIEIKADNDALNIHIPANTGPKNKGHIYLYAYLPTRGEVMPENAPIASVPFKAGDPELAGFQTQIIKDPLMLRPIVTRRDLGDWSGADIKMSYPLSQFRDLEIPATDLGYVVVIQEQGDVGAVLAMGETVPYAELIHTRSTPASISKP